jgi:riboflavin transporter FmnP
MHKVYQMNVHGHGNLILGSCLRRGLKKCPPINLHQYLPLYTKYMHDTYKNRKRWMWVAFSTPFFFLIIGFCFSMVIGVMSSDCPILMGNSVISLPSFEGELQKEPSEYCKTMNYLGTSIGPKISLISSALLIPSLLTGLMLFFMSRRPKSKELNQNQ